MFEKPIVKISDLNGDIYKIIERCEKALKEQGERQNEVELYQNMVQSMNEKVSESRSYIRTLSILMEYVNFN